LGATAHARRRARRTAAARIDHRQRVHDQEFPERRQLLRLQSDPDAAALARRSVDARAGLAAAAAAGVGACCICGTRLSDAAHEPLPFPPHGEDTKCCMECNATFVQAARATDEPTRARMLERVAAMSRTRGDRRAREAGEDWPFHGETGAPGAPGAPPPSFGSAAWLADSVMAVDNALLFPNLVRPEAVAEPRSIMGDALLREVVSAVLRRPDVTRCAEEVLGMGGGGQRGGSGGGGGGRAATSGAACAHEACPWHREGARFRRRHPCARHRKRGALQG